MTKQVLRQGLIKQLKKQDNQIKCLYDEELLEKLLATTDYQEATCLATYLSLPFEFSTSRLITHAKRDGKRVVVPKVISQTEMIMVDYVLDDLILSSFGIWEPKSSQEVPKDRIDMIHVPLIGVNVQGYRLGFGGGYYDRYLSDFSGDTIATVYPLQEIAFTPDSHDIALRKVIRI